VAWHNGIDSFFVFFLKLFGNLSISDALKRPVPDQLQERLDKHSSDEAAWEHAKYNFARTHGNLEIWARSWYL
jgi:hypothetical protein